MNPHKYDDDGGNDDDNTRGVFMEMQLLKSAEKFPCSFSMEPLGSEQRAREPPVSLQVRPALTDSISFWVLVNADRSCHRWQSRSPHAQS